MKGCNLQPGPDKFYLDGEDMQATGNEMLGRVSGVVIVLRGAVQVVVRWALLW